ncbi:hypothetical protein [Ruegeria arenilitoris]|uniref:hypothetical protein n=1 Tax=Ruegeria arenilitoris TaxID=1173585 RepID=UPI00147E6D78|nr:hypothetical protein [Ruegeria arenilitoris]
MQSKSGLRKLLQNIYFQLSFFAVTDFPKVGNCMAKMGQKFADQAACDAGMTDPDDPYWHAPNHMDANSADWRISPLKPVQILKNHPFVVT